MAVEILAPAGGYESLEAAVRCGADGVYVGGKSFSARGAAENFTAEELMRAAKYCHLHGVKLYRAMNTLITDEELESFADEVRASAQAGVDGLIIQDIGAARIAAAVVPQMPRHASTQMTVYTPLGARTLKEMGFCRIVPARELSLENISDICRTGVSTEVFVHGAQCVCLSGQCYMSAVIGSRSANRGHCAQACRLPFDDGAVDHALSLKDMSLLYHVDELISAGVESFKIEGRMKRPEYVAAAVTAFRHAVDGAERSVLDKDMKTLEAVFSRSGFTDGYLTGKVRDMRGYRRYEDVNAAKDVLPGLAALYRGETTCDVMSFDLDVKDKGSVLSYTTKDGFSGKVEGMGGEQAVKRPLDPERAADNLAKLGGTVYTPGNITVKVQEGLTLPVSEINRMRREAAACADAQRIAANTPSYRVNDFAYSPSGERKVIKPLLRFMAYRAQDIPSDTGADLITLPYWECERDDIKLPAQRICVSFPGIVTDEEGLLRRLYALRERGFVHYECTQLTHLGMLKKLPHIRIHGGSGLNITNSCSLEALKGLGFEDAIVSFELKAAQIAALSHPLPITAIVWGRLPLMTVRVSPKGKELCDRTGRRFPVIRADNASIIQNCDILDVMKSADLFGTEYACAIISPGEDAKDIERRFAARESLSGKGYTNGLYNRGVL